MRIVAAAALALAVVAGCVGPAPNARRTVTTIGADPRPPDDSNQLPLPVPAPQSGPGLTEGSAQSAP